MFISFWIHLDLETTWRTMESLHVIGRGIFLGKNPPFAIMVPIPRGPQK